jgi:hypothetical protein
MLGDKEFGLHGERHGHRLRKQIGLGPTAFQRQVRDVTPAAVVRRAELEAGAAHAAEQLVKGALPDLPPEGVQKVAERVVRAVRVGQEPKKGGRPRTIEGCPWEAEGISRRTWERRRKGGGSV